MNCGLTFEYTKLFLFGTPISRYFYISLHKINPMNMIDKISLHDFVGFVLPGAIVILALYMINGACHFYLLSAFPVSSFFFQCVLLLLSYIIGMFVHELSEPIFRRPWKISIACFKNGQNLTWQYKWYQQVFQKENENTRENIRNKLIVDVAHSINNEDFKKMYACVRKGKKPEFAIIHAQVVMLSNVTTALMLTSVLTIFAVVLKQDFQWHILFKCIIPQFLLIGLSFFVAIRRQKHLISTVYWEYGKN
jgi:hypothetical protein